MGGVLANGCAHAPEYDPLAPLPRIEYLFLSSALYQPRISIQDTGWRKALYHPVQPLMRVPVAVARSELDMSQKHGLCVSFGCAWNRC
jgi:hypothetical protein